MTEQPAEVLEEKEGSTVLDGEEVTEQQGALDVEGNNLEDEVEKAPALGELEPEMTNGDRQVDFSVVGNVPLTLSLEVGRVKIPLKKLLGLNKGSIVEFDRRTDEPMDLLVNGELVAQGEVVVVNGRFAVRLMDVVSRKEK